MSRGHPLKTFGLSRGRCSTPGLRSATGRATLLEQSYAAGLEQPVQTARTIMENYPNIERRDGTLFFACPEADKGAIATSIERLIDMLDAMDDDPDLEPDGDESDTGMPEGWRHSSSSAWDGRQAYVFEDEEYDGCHEGNLGAPERHPGKDVRKSKSAQRDHSQEFWASGDQSKDEIEGNDEDLEDGGDAEPDDSGYGDCEGMVEDTSGEYSLGWTNNIDQTEIEVETIGWFANDGEPDLGWNLAGDCGDIVAASEGRELDDERESDPADAGVADRDALSDLEGSCSQLAANQAGFAFDNSGIDIAEDMIRGLPIAAKRAAAYASIAIPVVYSGLA